MTEIDLSPLKAQIDGDLLTDDLHKILYATDASVYREIPLGVVLPKHSADIQNIIRYCHKHKVPVIPRAGGTSLAGQCVGSGLVIDVSKYMNSLISINAEEKSVTVQPGIIRDELNLALKSHGLMVGPNTSTANRATIGGMVGNNSCGSTSIVFGNTRDHVTEIKAILSDGSDVVFKSLSKTEFELKCQLQSLEGEIYRYLNQLLTDKNLQAEIDKEYPNSAIKRRNTGYALDELMDCEVFLDSEKKINVCNLLCGSEGTLAFTTEVTIGLVDVPPAFESLVAIHYESVDASLRSVPTIMMHQPFACELMDKTILDCTKGQKLYERDRFFIEGDPSAVMLVSFVNETKEGAESAVIHLIARLKSEEHGYSFPIINDNIKRIWNLRKAGLGLLANLPGDKKAVACIEDTSVLIEDLSAYIREFTDIMASYGQDSVYYAHAGAGELHLRPILDLKQTQDRQMFHDISLASARLVKKYNGSLSGEHGDGRVRAPFIKEMYGEDIYQVFTEMKAVWDPNLILNPGKIVDAPPMNHYLRYDEGHVERAYDTVFDFSSTGGVLRAAEKCNGSGDCRKLPLSGGTMCPSYQATRDEKDTTRARANILREVLTRPKSDNAWDNEELKDVMDLCLSCKGCASECPSNVDMSAMKAEFLHQYQQKNGVPLRSKVFSNFAKLSKLGSAFGGLTNLLLGNPLTGTIAKKILGVHPKRSFPKIHNNTLRKRFKNIQKEDDSTRGTVYLFCDEFTNYNDAQIGETAIKLLQKLGFNVKMIDHPESGRAAISKGVLDLAKRFANKNVEIFSKLISAETPLIGIEPSTILSFRDEYPLLVDSNKVEDAKRLAKNTFTIEEFLYQEVKKGNLTSDMFDNEKRSILLHGHCHQKALTDINEVAWLLSLPSNHKVEIIPSGCCGMAGSFGYESEHYEVSMQVGELVLFPAVKNAPNDTIIAASGTSCRHQILDGTNVKSKHVLEVIYEVIM